MPQTPKPVAATKARRRNGWPALHGESRADFLKLALRAVLLEDVPIHGSWLESFGLEPCWVDRIHRVH